MRWTAHRIANQVVPHFWWIKKDYARELWATTRELERCQTSRSRRLRLHPRWGLSCEFLATAGSIGTGAPTLSVDAAAIGFYSFIFGAGTTTSAAA